MFMQKSNLLNYYQKIKLVLTCACVIYMQVQKQVSTNHIEKVFYEVITTTFIVMSLIIQTVCTCL